ncbi:hypothetical protein HA402_004433 [Bradysia odoriphaga]|nr:hypothetical protein HA402_004433 [Bradysia odoriphaga]
MPASDRKCNKNLQDAVIDVDTDDRAHHQNDESAEVAEYEFTSPSGVSDESSGGNNVITIKFENQPNELHFLADETTSYLDELENQPIAAIVANSEDHNEADETSSLVTIIEWTDTECDFEEQLQNNSPNDDSEHDDKDEISEFVDNFEESQFDVGSDIEDETVNQNFDSSEQPSSIDNEQQKDKFQLSGRRFADIGLIFDQFKNMDQHSDTCRFADMECVNENKKGLLSIFEFKCSTCGYQQEIASNKTMEAIDVNEAAVLGVTSIGLGSYHLNEFCSHMQIPCMSQFIYSRRDKNLQTDWWELAQKEALSALHEEIRLAILNGDVDSAGNALILIVCDGSWPKRSYTSNFTSLSGCAVIIGVRTDKVIYFDVKNKYCHVCKIAQSNKKEPREHECNTNYVGPASSMETTIVLEGFEACEKHGLRFKEYIADGDSSTYKAICDRKIYQNPEMDVEKKDCCNHNCRNFRRAMEALSKATKRFKQGARKFVTKKIANDICMGIQTASKHWRESDVNLLEKLVNLEKDVSNAPFHYYGIHDECEDYYCSKTTEPEAREIVDMLKTEGIFNEILNICQTYFGSSVPSLLLNYNNNAAESFNNLIAKYTGGKRINYCLAKSYKSRVARGVVQYNTRGCSGSAFHEFKKSTETQPLKTLEQCRKRKCEKNAAAKKTKPKKARYSVQAQDKGQDYGECCQTNDMAPHLFEIAKTRYLEPLLKDQENRDFVNASTAGKHLVQKWREMQSKILTSWYFSRIINARGPASYTNIVDDIVYKKLILGNNAELRHQRIYAKKALQCFIDAHGSNYLSECGIFIDEDHCFLGASPFRLHGPTGIVFVKCPVEAFKLNIDEAIDKKLIAFWKRNNGVETINKSSAWYIEVQAELHITRRVYAFVVVFVESDSRIEKIYRDDTFWSETMEKPLVFFYEQAMLKELVNPRRQRSMKLRAYNPTTKTFD